jgi:hypothetical protein
VYQATVLTAPDRRRLGPVPVGRLSGQRAPGKARGSVTRVDFWLSYVQVGSLGAGDRAAGS